MKLEIYIAQFIDFVEVNFSITAKTWLDKIILFGYVIWFAIGKKNGFSKILKHITEMVGMQ